ncbi:MAG: hypothetical protein KA821_19965, partial [Chitinophagaceae bacterium]|nr:hypothetical protein [Chitinophagaceae bacterium]
MLQKTTIAQNWTTTGNSGLTTSNFVGNTDSVALIFRTNNTERMRMSANGYLSIGTPNYENYRLNISGGLKTTADIMINGITIGKGTANGNHNTVVGNSAFLSNTTGTGNTGVGSFSLRYNKAGLYNTALGYFAAGMDAADSSVSYAVGLGAYSRNKGLRSIAVGASAVSEAYAVGLGYGAYAADQYSLSVGYNSSSPGGLGNVVLGGNSHSSHAGNIVLGYNMTTTAAYQLLIGNATPGYSTRDVYIGGGVTQTTAASYAPLTIQPTGQIGTDQQGQTIRIATGKGTGAGNSGDIHLMTSVPTSSGTTLQSLATSVIVKGSGNVGIGTTSPSAQLHTTGSVRLAGLTMDSTRIRVLV